MWAAQAHATTSSYPNSAHHLRRPRHDGLRGAGGDRRARSAKPDDAGLVDLRRRRLPDDACRSWPRWSTQNLAGEDGDHQQRLPRHGPPVAGAVLRGQDYVAVAGSASGLREARRGLRHQGAASVTKNADRIDGASSRRPNRPRRPGPRRLPVVEAEGRTSGRWSPPAPRSPRPLEAPRPEQRLVDSKVAST